MQCSECHREAPGESLFCPHCGARLEAEGGAVATEAQEPMVTHGNDRFLAAARHSLGGEPPREQELWVATYSPKAMYGLAIGAGIVTILGAIAASFANGIGWAVFVIGALLIWGGLGVTLLYRRMTVHYRLTTYRFFHETGLLSRIRNRIEVIDINDVTLRQGIWERLFDVGTIHIQSSDQSHPELDLPGIEHVKAVADLIDDTRRAERQRRGLFMENI